MNLHRGSRLREETLKKDETTRSMRCGLQEVMKDATMTRLNVLKRRTQEGILYREAPTAIDACQDTYSTRSNWQTEGSTLSLIWFWIVIWACSGGLKQPPSDMVWTRGRSRPRARDLPPTRKICYRGRVVCLIMGLAGINHGLLNEINVKSWY